MICFLLASAIAATWELLPLQVGSSSLVDPQTSVPSELLSKVSRPYQLLTLPAFPGRLKEQPPRPAQGKAQESLHPTRSPAWPHL